MAWTTRVIPVSIGLEETGYAHQVVNGHREITVTHHTHRNWEHIHEVRLPDGLYQRTGMCRREPDLTAHPDAVKIAAALNAI